jgi:hypothetical protein
VCASGPVSRPGSNRHQAPTAFLKAVERIAACARSVSCLSSPPASRRCELPLFGGAPRPSRSQVYGIVRFSGHSKHGLKPADRSGSAHHLGLLWTSSFLLALANLLDVDTALSHDLTL